MTLLTLARARRDAGAEFSDVIVQEIIWVLAAPSDNLEHIHVSRVTDKLHVAMFFNARTPGEARIAGIKLLTQACEISPALQDWKICE